MKLTIRYGLLSVLVLTGAMGERNTPLRQLPLSFEVNRGQAEQKAKFVARGQGFALRFDASETVIGLAPGDGRQAAVTMRYRGAQQPWMKLEERQGHEANYFRGDRAVTKLAQYGKLRYRDLYPGVDLVFYGNQRNYEYDFVVKPGADPASIEVEISGARRLDLRSDGSLVMETGAGTITHQPPVVYQRIGGRRVEVFGRYRLASNRVRFEVGEYDRSADLVIDPILQYSSYVGGSAPANNADDLGQAIALDGEGNIYIAGRTQSSDLPLQGAVQLTNKGSGDAFVMKLDPTGKKVLYATYLGGGSLEYAYGIVVDGSGQAHVTGVTGSRDFPLKNAHQDKNTGLNIVFVTKLNAQGNALAFSTYLGGERNDAPAGIALDRYGNVYVGGRTNSAQFPMLNAIRATPPGGGDGFLAKFNPEGRLQYSTYFGGPSGDEIQALTADADGNVYFAGFSSSLGLATSNAYRTQPVAQEAFVGKLNATGTAYAYVTYYGGRGADQAHAIAVDGAGNAYIGGWTGSTDLPRTEGVVQPTRSGPSDGFIAKINDTGSAVLWSTYLGGSGATSAIIDEYVKSIAVDADGCVYVAGSTVTTDFPVERAVQDKSGGARDLFIAKLLPDASKLIFSTYFGGAGRDEEPALAVSPLRAVFVTGQTFSADYPLENAAQTKRGSNSDGLLTQICDPVLFASAGRLDFEYTQSKELPKAQLWNVVACHDLPLELKVEGDWIAAQAATGKLPANVTVSVNPAGLEPGEYSGSVTLSAPDTFFGPVKVEVKFRVWPAPPPPSEN